MRHRVSNGRQHGTVQNLSTGEHHEENDLRSTFRCLETLPATDAAYVSIGAYLVVTIVLSALVHKLVEVPVARAMHWLIPRWRRPALQGI
jgi:hypothetical protein